MIKNFLPALILVLFLACSGSRKFIIEEEQHGLLEPILITKPDSLISIDTIYNPLGGVVKTLKIKKYIRSSK